MKQLFYLKGIRSAAKVMSILLAIGVFFLSFKAEAATSCSDIFSSSNSSETRQRFSDAQATELRSIRDHINSFTAAEMAPDYPYKNSNDGLIYLLTHRQEMPPIPQSQQGYYTQGDRRSGERSYSLSLENGRQPLDVIRIAFTKTPDSAWTVSTFIDYVRVLEKVPGLRLLVAVEKSERSDLDQIINQQRVDIRNRIEIIESEHQIDVWAQDGSKPIDISRTTISGGGRRYDTAIRAVRESGKISVLDSKSFELQGGDIVVGDHHVIIGVNQLRKVAKDLAISNEDATQVLTESFNKPVIVAGIRATVKDADGVSRLGWVPWHFHIDLDMVLAVNRNTNKEVALVHSPEAFFKLLAPQAPLSEVPTVPEVKRAIQIVVNQLVQKTEAGILLSKGEMDMAEFLSSYPTVSIQAEVMKGRLFRRSLEEQGYEVQELPGLGILDNTTGTAYSGSHFFFGTNAVLSGNTALVPSNRIPALDAEIVRIYQSLGYNVIPMQSASKSIIQWGGTRCASETCRKPYIPLKSRPK